MTLEEARKLLPDVKEKLLKLRKVQKAIAIVEDIDIEYEKPCYEYVELDLDLNKRFYKLNFLFFRYLDELHKKGVVIKDLEEGLVDFYSKKGNKEIYFCWKLGEKNIEFWHDEESGFEERKSVKELGLKRVKQ